VRRLLISHSHRLRQDKAELSDTSDLACVLCFVLQVLGILRSKPGRQSAVTTGLETMETSSLHVSSATRCKAIPLITAVTMLL
jgi:hypothetical protein